MTIAVIGGGVIGLSAAYFLRQRGADVTILESDECGAGTSRGNAGWITPSLSAPIPAPGVMTQALRWMVRADSPFFIRPQLNFELARWCYQFARNCSAARHRDGLRATLELNRHTMELFDAFHEGGVSFEMHSEGLLFIALAESELRKEETMFGQLKNAGFEGAVERLDRQTLEEHEPSVSERVVGGIYVATERHIRPETLTRGLSQYLRDNGVRIHERSPVRGMQRKNGKWHLAADDPITVDAVIIATGAHSQHMMAAHLGVKLPLQTAKGYSVTAVGEGRRPGHPLYFAEAKVGCSPYADRVRLAGTLELGATSLTLSPRRVEAITRSADAYLRDWRPVRPELEWAGLRTITPDGLPLIGEVPGHPGAYLGTGHGLLGITLAPATGDALARLAHGEDVPELRPFRLSRSFH